MNLIIGIIIGAVFSLMIVFIAWQAAAIYLLKKEVDKLRLGKKSGDEVLEGL